jgi:hypothetical protein
LSPSVNFSLFCFREIANSRKGLFDRIVIDEAHSIRKSDLTKTGKVLRSSDARFRCLFTGSLVVDTIEDMKGYLSFLQKEHWASPDDHNRSFGAQERRSRYSLFRLGLPSNQPVPDTLPVGSASSSRQPNTIDNWYDSCPSVAGLTSAQVQAKQDGGWRCRH